jgi:hypothetical protein
MTDPKKWRDMTPEEKGSLLLAHHEGKEIQIWCVDEWATSRDPSWAGHCAYRVKPPEPRVWYMNFYNGVVGGVYDSKHKADAMASTLADRKCVRVVECPDD